MQSHYSRKGSEIILVKKLLPSVTILATSRLIHTEAAPILAQKLYYIYLQPMQYIIDEDYHHYFTSPNNGMLVMIINAIHDTVDQGFIEGYESKWGLSWMLESAQFVSECVEWQLTKRSTDASVLEDIQITLRLAPRHDDDSDDEFGFDAEFEDDDVDLGLGIRNFLQDVDGLERGYFTKLSLKKPYIFARLCEDEDIWNKLINEYTGPTGQWRNWSLPTLSDQTWSEEWGEGEFHP